MKRSAWTLLWVALAASAAVQARTLRDENGNPLGGGRESPERSAPERSAQERSAPEHAAPQRDAPVHAAPAPRPPDATPSPPRPPSVPTPRFGVDRTGAQPGAPRDDRPAQRPSDPSQGRWSTLQPGQGGSDRDWNGRNDSRRDERSWARDDWQRSRVIEPPRRTYQWRDYDWYRQQHFRLEQGRYFGRSRYYAGAFLWPRGFGVRSWLVGEWLPSAFFLDSRYGLDYWRFGLYEPPAGCRWVRVGSDALLVDDFNGEVLDAVYDMFW